MPVVDVATIGKTASAIVFIVAILSLAIGFLTGFQLIYPPMAGFIAWSAGFFYIMSRLLEGQWKK